jgi:hypothetical protein
VNPASVLWRDPDLASSRGPDGRPRPSLPAVRETIINYLVTSPAGAIASQAVTNRGHGLLRMFSAPSFLVLSA